MDRFVSICQKIRDTLDKLFDRLFALLMFRVRLLPIVIFCASILLSLKIVNLKDQVDRYALEIEASRAFAAANEKDGNNASQQAQKTERKEAANPDSQASAGDVKEASAQQGEKGLSATTDVTKLDPAALSPEAFQALRQSAEARQKAAEPKAAATEASASKGETEQNNAAPQLSSTPVAAATSEDPIKQATLQSLESKLDQKVEELKKAEQKLTDLMNKIDEEENVNTKRLVKMAEAMQPKEAAAILEGLDFPILLELMERIKEAKASAILSNMEPQKASFLMTELAKRKKIFKKDNPDHATTTSPS